MSRPYDSRPESDTPSYDPSPNGDTGLDDPLDPPVEEQFWKKYNANFELPIGWALAVLAYMLLAALIACMILVLPRGSDSRPVKVIGLGSDDSGDGSPGGGGVENPIAVGNPTQADLARPELPQDLNLVKEELEKKLQIDDPTANIPIRDEVAAAIGSLDKELQDKLLGMKKGSGNGNGSGDDRNGNGPGGTGADSTRARGMRWIMRFNTRSGHDYLAQLKALKA